MFFNVNLVEKQSKNKESKDLGCACYGNNQVHHCFCNDIKPLKLQKVLQKVEVTMQEIWQQTTPKIYASKKTYRRKNKHKNELE